MKKNLALAILIFIACLPVYAQDKIITLDKDTINCKITKVTRTTIFFDIYERGLKTSGDENVNNISDYIISVNKDPKNDIESHKGLPTLRFSMSGGLGYLLGSTLNAEDEIVSMGFDPGIVHSYYSDLKSGLYANADLSLLFKTRFGAGLKYKFFETNGSMEGFIDPPDGINLYYTSVNEQVYVNYAGAAFYVRQFIDSKKSLVLNSSYSAGLAYYRDEAELLNEYYLIKGKNIGLDVSLGLEYFISSWFSVGTDLSVFYSQIQKMTLSNGTTSTTMDLDKKDYENLSRIELSVGVKFYLWNK